VVTAAGFCDWDGETLGVSGVIGTIEELGRLDCRRSNSRSADGIADGKADGAGNISGVTTPGPLIPIIIFIVIIILSGMTAPGPFIPIVIIPRSLSLPIIIGLGVIIGHVKNMRIDPFHINIGHVNCILDVIDDDDHDIIMDFMLLLRPRFLFLRELLLLLLLRFLLVNITMLMLLIPDDPLRFLLNFDIFIKDRRAGLGLSFGICSFTSTTLLSGT
jgi:hypothetical protein